MKTLKKFFFILNQKEKRSFIFLIFMVTLVAFAEAISIGSLIPLINMVLDSQYVDTFRQIINFEIINEISKERFVIFVLISVFSFFSIKYLFLIIFYYLLHKFTFNLKYRLQKNTFENYLNRDLMFFKKNNTSFLLRNLTSEIDQFSVAINSYLIVMSELFIILALGSVAAYTQTSKVIIGFLFLTFISILCFKYIRLKTAKLGQSRRENIGNQIKVINDAFGLIIDIVLLKKQTFFVNKFKNFSKITNSSLFRHNFYKSLPRIIFEWLFLAIIILMLLYLINDDNFSGSIANLTFLIAIMFKVIPSFNKIFVSFQDIKFSGAVINELNQSFLEMRKNLLHDKKNEDNKFEFTKQEFRNVDFNYNNKRSIIENLNFTLNKNTFIGISGDSGGGKTTFLNLILGLLRPSKGQIYVNNDNIDGTIEKLQNVISYVPQDIYLIDSDIKENVSLEEEVNLTEDKINNIKVALREAEFFSEEGIITDEFLSQKVGQKGINLSGGQVQRVGIARAFYRKSQILILDEATRSLDKSTEKEIIETLIKKKKNLTIIMISHNIENFKYCDTVYEVKDKSIIKLKNHKL